MSGNLKRDIVELKDLEDRQFKIFKENFYLAKAAVRYFAVKNQMSFTAARVADNFPLTIPSAGSCLNMLEQLGVIKSRTQSSSPNRYMPQSTDIERLKQVEKTLVENYEIEEF